MRTLLLFSLALVACKDKSLEWKAHTIKTVEVGPFKLDIPKGWRDLNEAADPHLANLTKRLGSDTEAQILVRESAANTDSNISFMWTDLMGQPSCDQWVRAMTTMGGPSIDPATVVEQTYGADKGCSFRVSDGSTEGKMFLRLRPPKFLTIQCLRSAKGDAALDATCETLAATMGAQ